MMITKVLCLGSETSKFYKSISSTLKHFDKVSYVDEHSFSKAVEVVQAFNMSGADAVLMPNPYGNNRRLNCFKQLKEHNVPVIASDRGALPNSWFFDHGHNADSPSYHPEKWDYPLDTDIDINIDNYIQDLCQNSETLETNGTRYGAEEIRRKLSIPKDKKIVLVPLQRPNDTVIKFLSKPVGSVENFIRWVEQAESLVNNQSNEYVFLLKKHPLESQYIEIKGNKNNIRYVSADTHIHDLIEVSDAIVLINSGVGLISLGFQKPTICCGESFYAHSGLAVNAKSVVDLASLLKNPPKPDYDKVKRFYNHLINNVYSFGSFNTERVRDKDGAYRTETISIDFKDVKILGQSLYSVNNSESLTSKIGGATKKKNVLFIVPLSPIPIYRGNQVRINSIIKSALSIESINIYLCVVNTSLSKKKSKDYKSELINYFSGVKDVHVIKSANQSNDTWGRLNFKYLSYKDKLLNKHKVSKDALCPPKLKRVVARMVSDFNIDTIFTNYVYTMPSIPREFLGKVIIDTHDFQTNHLISEQKEHSYKKNINIDKFRGNELSLLQRADTVIAINKSEELIFEENSNGKYRSITVPQFFEDQSNSLIPFWDYEYDTSFIGSAANFNISGLSWFISEVMPVIIKQMPEFKIAVVGDVCKSEKIQRLAKNSNNIVLLGRVADLNSAYASSKTIVAPILGGAGMKIKVVEAMSYGKVVIGTSAAYDGIAKQENFNDFISDNPVQYAANLLSSLQDATHFTSLEKKIKNLFELNHSLSTNLAIVNDAIMGESSDTKN